jgi:hypothetical protein
LNTQPLKKSLIDEKRHQLHEKSGQMAAFSNFLKITARPGKAAEPQFPSESLGLGTAHLK